MDAVSRKSSVNVPGETQVGSKAVGEMEAADVGLDGVDVGGVGEDIADRLGCGSRQMKIWTRVFLTGVQAEVDNMMVIKQKQDY